MDQRAEAAVEEKLFSSDRTGSCFISRSCSSRSSSDCSRQQRKLAESPSKDLQQPRAGLKRSRTSEAGRSGFPELPAGLLPGCNWEQWGERCLTAALTLIQLFHLNFRRKEHYRAANAPHAPLITATLMLMLLINRGFVSRPTNNRNMLNPACICIQADVARLMLQRSLFKLLQPALLNFKRDLILSPIKKVKKDGARCQTPPPPCWLWLWCSGVE